MQGFSISWVEDGVISHFDIYNWLLIYYVLQFGANHEFFGAINNFFKVNTF